VSSEVISDATFPWFGSKNGEFSSMLVNLPSVEVPNDFADFMDVGLPREVWCWGPRMDAKYDRN